MSLVGESDEVLDLVWGCAAIAAVIQRSERSVFHLLENGRSPSVGQNAPKSAEGRNPLSSVGQVENSAVISMLCAGKEPGRGSLKNLDSRIVPDACWPGMYRIRLPGGELTDMVNLTRAKDALAALAERRRP